MSAPETYAESPVSCVFPAVPGTGEKVMPKKLHWKYLLYVLMVAYVLFVGTNMYQFNAMMEFGPSVSCGSLARNTGNENARAGNAEYHARPAVFA